MPSDDVVTMADLIRDDPEMARRVRRQSAADIMALARQAQQAASAPPAVVEPAPAGDRLDEMLRSEDQM